MARNGAPERIGRDFPRPTFFAIAQSLRQTWDHFSWDHFSRIGGATFSAGAGGSAG